MPSPIGHGLASLAVGWAAARPGADRTARRRQAVILCALGLAPDLDLLVGRHSGETHSIGAALVVAGVAALMRWPVARTRARIFLAVAAVWLAHPLLDAMAPDGTAPFGVMLWWPFSPAYVQFDVTPFMPISRRYWLPGFVVHTLTAVARELVIIGPVTAFVWWWRRASGVGSDGGRGAGGAPAT